MTVVTTLTTPLPVPDDGWTAEYLDAFPDDGLRYELVDGVLLVKRRRPRSTRAIDLTLKRHVFEQGGIASYWLVDPLTPSLTVLELRAGSYVEVAQVSGAEPFEAAAPFPVRVVPAELVR